MLLTVIEAAVLAWLHRRRGRGVALADVGLNMASGLCLMLALRLLLGGADAAPVLLCLSAAGVLHGCDLWRRWH